MWPERVLQQFSIVPPYPFVNDFHGPYNMLLHTLFPLDTNIAIGIHFIPDPKSTDNYCTAMFEVMLENKPVFILALDHPKHIKSLSKRQAADDQIRLYMADLILSCPLNTLHAVSAFGTKLAFYSLPTGAYGAEITPLAIARHPTKIIDTVPADRWDCDLLEAQGEARFRAIIQEIKNGCAQL